MRVNSGNVYLFKVDRHGAGLTDLGRKLFGKKKKKHYRNLSSDLGKYNLTRSPLSSNVSFYKSGFSAQSVKRNLNFLSHV